MKSLLLAVASVLLVVLYVFMVGLFFAFLAGDWPFTPAQRRERAIKRRARVYRKAGLELEGAYARARYEIEEREKAREWAQRGGCF